MLLESFEDSVKILQELAEKNKRRVDKLGHLCSKQEKEHAARIGELEGHYSVSGWVGVALGELEGQVWVGGWMWILL